MSDRRRTLWWTAGTLLGLAVIAAAVMAVLLSRHEREAESSRRTTELGADLMREAGNRSRQENEEAIDRERLAIAKMDEREIIDSLRDSISTSQQLIRDQAASAAEYEATANQLERIGESDRAIRFRGLAARANETLSQFRSALEVAQRSLE